MAGYVSDHTQFIREWMEKNPEEAKEQDKGMSLWWNKPPMPLDDAARLKAARTPSTSYYYDPYSKF